MNFTFLDLVFLPLISYDFAFLDLVFLSLLAYF